LIEDGYLRKVVEGMKEEWWMDGIERKMGGT
jgi:hypothetical protein